MHHYIFKKTGGKRRLGSQSQYISPQRDGSCLTIQRRKKKFLALLFPS
jgi:hypothetical protein